MVLCEVSQIGKFIIARVIDVNLNSNSDLFQKLVSGQELEQLTFLKLKLQVLQV